MAKLTMSIALVTLLLLGPSRGEVAAQGQPDGQLTVAFDVSIAPSFLEPAETPGTLPATRTGTTTHSG
jgi:hypothetical protein